MKPFVDDRLDALRGPALRLPYNARSLAALENNPRCTLRALLDVSGSDKAAIAAHIGYPAPFGQSAFAFARGNAFESVVKDNGCAELLRVLRETLELTLPEVAYLDLNDVGGAGDNHTRHEHTARLLLQAARGTGDGTLFDHPLLHLKVGGQDAFLEPDLVAFRIDGRFYVVEIKSFPIIDGQADPAQVRAATTQACAYIIALRALLAQNGISPEAVSDTIVLVAPKDFTNRPTAAFVDARKQVAALTRQLARLERISDLVDLLPEGLTFDLDFDKDRRPRRPAEELAAAVEQVPATYRPDCLNHCEMAFYCRERARAEASLDVLGPAVREQLGGIDTATMALGLARGQLTPTVDQSDMAAALRHAARLRDELTGAYGGAA
ncbi:hypothetical protein SAZ_42730 [Streptomyces noursei ZPM]|uniref:Secreted protein n=1 Tax=Streptomyces noursei TaxID=1971 RepID=A0A401QRM3_STRNR|nr:hypothetical protein [Streptomyces noursei]AKA01158.1 hypothetical protein SAZ_00075 [Streptomyces noursei ZPM]AKA08255.1 hypothetical protein SAZ_42730 [Streptomyces noursei ZPM]EOT03639.2 hypothetical protein K530_12582 [Streptomyces noursei CCRC 11814]EXU92360.1 hypothetical protein P354_21160 [Streptomyces noursei PD-1]UWS69833.1 hypothetical protein N1H47_00145 [Streptomyces noursei]